MNARLVFSWISYDENGEQASEVWAFDDDDRKSIGELYRKGSRKEWNLDSSLESVFGENSFTGYRNIRKLQDAMRERWETLNVGALA